MQPRKIEQYLTLIGEIRFENEHGGRYAFMQYLAYSRELVKLLEGLPNSERHVQNIEAVSWLFNECITAKPAPRHRAIFESKMFDLRENFDEIRFSLQWSASFNKRTRHALAA